jgi:hypothetical protein
MRAYIKLASVLTTILLFNGCTQLEEDSKLSEEQDYLPEGLTHSEVLPLNDQRLATAIESLDGQLNKGMNQKLFLESRGECKRC